MKTLSIFLCLTFFNFVASKNISFQSLSPTSTLRKKLKDMETNIGLPLQNIADIKTIAHYLARRDEKPSKADLLILLGNSHLDVMEEAAKFYHQKIAKKIMVAGGKGHSTPYLALNVKNHPKYFDVNIGNRSKSEIFNDIEKLNRPEKNNSKDILSNYRPEADILKDILLTHLGINSEDILIENTSTNCGSNAVNALKVLKENNLSITSVLLMQDPTMQQRTHACFQREWKKENVFFISYAAFIPNLENTERFLSLIMGEIKRLRDAPDGYGPKGLNFIDSVEIPESVLEAYSRLQDKLANHTRKANPSFSSPTETSF